MLISYSLLIAHCSLLIAHCSLLIAHCSLLIADIGNDSDAYGSVPLPSGVFICSGFVRNSPHRCKRQSKSRKTSSYFYGGGEGGYGKGNGNIKG